MPSQPVPGPALRSSSTPQDVPSAPLIASPPAKHNRKATRRKCEVELLRENDSDDELLLTPTSHALVSPPSPKSVSPASPLAPPGPVVSRFPSIERTDEASTLTPLQTITPEKTPPMAPAPPTTPPAQSVLQAEIPDRLQPPPSSQPTAPPAKEEPQRAPAGPPPPPPWSEAFSTDPDRIICRKCCKRSYVFRWYTHCYMCHSWESKT
jgi:hypothetical protein